MDENKYDKGTSTQMLLKEKEDTIQLLKKKLKILATQLIQDSKLSELERDKERLNGKLTECQSQLLKFIEK